MRILLFVVAALAVSACEEAKSAAPQAAKPAPAATAPATAPAAPVCQGAGCGPGDPLAPLPGAPTTAAKLDLPGQKYGEGVTLNDNTAVSEILAKPDAWAGKRVRIEGEVDDVCQMAGCWMAVKSAEGKAIKFKVTDGQIVFPKDSAGKHAIAEGTVRLIPMSLEQTRKMKKHEADEQGKPFDPESVTAPETLVRLDGIGAVLSDKK